MSKKRALGYLRVSTKQQIYKYGFPAQKEQITAYAKEHGYEIVDWFEENLTGYSEERPEMSKILQGNYDVDYLIVAKSDRFARNIEYYYALKLQLRRIGIELVSVNEDFGSMGVLKPAMEALVASYAEIERITINQRTSGGRETKRRIGGYCGGSVPYGYDVANGSLVINPKQAKVVRNIYEMRDSGMSLRSICDELNKLGFKSSRGGNFNPSTVKVILDNENTYKGMYRYGKDTDWVEGQQAAILGEAYRW